MIRSGRGKKRFRRSVGKGKRNYNVSHHRSRFEEAAPASLYGNGWRELGRSSSALRPTWKFQSGPNGKERERKAESCASRDREMENEKGRESTLIHLFGFCLFIRQVSLMKL